MSLQGILKVCSLIKLQQWNEIIPWGMDQKLDSNSTLILQIHT